jgi:hypothetical protein
MHPSQDVQILFWYFNCRAFHAKPDILRNNTKAYPPQQEEYILSSYREICRSNTQTAGIEIKNNRMKIVYVGNHLEAFIKWKFKKSRLFFVERISSRAFDDLDYYLKTESIAKSPSTKSFKG